MSGFQGPSSRGLGLGLRQVHPLQEQSARSRRYFAERTDGPGSAGQRLEEDRNLELPKRQDKQG